MPECVPSPTATLLQDTSQRQRMPMGTLGQLHVLLRESNEFFQRRPRVGRVAPELTQRWVVRRRDRSYAGELTAS